jgi:hypothetical protein
MERAGWLLLAATALVLGPSSSGVLGFSGHIDGTSSPEINCGACKGLFDEIDYLISKTPKYAKIDTGSQRMDSVGKMAQKKKSYARSEVHLYEMLEGVCAEMTNYSGFVEQIEENGKKRNVTLYHRYQNRPEEKTPLKLKNFGWSSDTQAQLRLGCDNIANNVEEELVEAYMAWTEVEFKKDLCGMLCKKAKTSYMLNPWHGLDSNGNPVSETDNVGGNVYVNGRVDAEALARNNKKAKKLHDKKIAKEERIKKRKDKLENEKKLREMETPDIDPSSLPVGSTKVGPDGQRYVVSADQDAKKKLDEDLASAKKAGGDDVGKDEL